MHRKNRAFPRSLIRLARNYVIRRGWQSMLMVLGIALGVAVMVSIDLANASASRAFELSTESITGKATHQIQRTGFELEDELYVEIKKMGLNIKLAPVLSAYVGSSDLANQPYQLLGIDPFADEPFRGYLGGDSLGSDLPELTTFFVKPGAVVLSQTVSDQFGLNLGVSFVLQLDGRVLPVFLAGQVRSNDALARRAMDGIILVDLATAQELTGKIGKISRIDLILPPETADETIAQIQEVLPAGVTIQPVEARIGSVQKMTSAFQVNLSALSMLALVVGLFLIYNTTTFSVVQRRALFGTLRSLGVTRREIFQIVLIEAGLVGLVGSGIGVGLGIIMGSNTVAMITQTINDLYFTTTIRDVGLPVSSLIKGGVVGFLATMAAAVPPAVEAAGVDPRQALIRSGLESKARKGVWILAGVGTGLIILGLVLFQIPAANLFFGFGGTFSVVIGFAMLSALSLRGLMRAAVPILGKTFGLLGRMAPRNLVNSLSRTAVAVAALMVAVAVTIGITLMIDSFRYTVSLWLEQTLQGDVYVSAPSFTANTSVVEVDPQAVTQIQNYPGTDRVDLLRSTTLDSPNGVINVSASSNPQIGLERIFKSVAVSQSEMHREMLNGGVLVSEPLANRLGLESGGVLPIQTSQGVKDLPILGIFYDYASSEGSIMMSMEYYQNVWKDFAVTAVGIRLPAGVDPDSFAAQLREEVTTGQQLVVRANRALREDVMEIFDRTFAITAALQILATVVAFIGVLSTLLLLQLEKQREIGILKAIGLTGRQLWRLVMLETGLMGLTAGMLAAPTGLALSLILIYVINLRSFGWTLQLFVDPLAFLSALGLAVFAALLAGVIPAMRLSKMPAAEAIRFE